jgi:hypothetical protein
MYPVYFVTHLSAGHGAVASLSRLRERVAAEGRRVTVHACEVQLLILTIGAVTLTVALPVTVI